VQSFWEDDILPDLESSRPEPHHGNSAGPHHGYDPNQPRVPSGHSDGGQWTKTPGSGTPTIARREAVVDHSKQESWGSYVDGYRPDGSLAEQRVFNRDGSRIVSEFNPPDGPGDWDERHTVVLPDGTKFAFENSDNVQRIYDGEGNLVNATEWTKEGPRPLPIDQLAGVALAVPLVMALSEAEILALGTAAAALFSWLSSRKDPNRTAVLAFKASKYEKGEPQGRNELSWVGYVKRDELKDVCKKLPDVQGYTDKAVQKVLQNGDYGGPAAFGTKVHKLIADTIQGLDEENFQAEVSRIKSKEEDARYGEKGSIRIDALENHSDISTVCVYDPKTGKRGLSLPRTNELAETAFKKFKYVPNHIIVIEVRPGQR
jgi:hypothetical protein